jgi:hypothetical protein
MVTLFGSLVSRLVAIPSRRTLCLTMFLIEWL